MFWERFYNLCIDNGTKPNAVAKQLGFSSAVCTQWKQRGTTPKIEYLQKIAAYFGVSVDYLTGGSPLPDTLEPVSPSMLYDIPIYESVSAGFGAYASDCICGYMPLYISSPSEAEQTIIIRVRGDSMYPVIPDGACVQVLRQDYAENGQIVVMLIDGDEGVLKRYFANAERQEVRLESYNPAYPPRIFRAAELDKLRLVGVAKRVITDLPCAIRRNEYDKTLIFYAVIYTVITQNCAKSDEMGVKFSKKEKVRKPLILRGLRTF